MSLENAKRFIEAAGKDQALQKELGAAREPADVLRLAVQAGSERGLPFTTEEFLASLGPRPGDGGGELSDDQLESVAGGFGPGMQDLVRFLIRGGKPAPTPEPTPSQDVSLSHEPLHGRS